MIPPCGTFRYVVRVPTEGENAAPWPVSLSEPIEITGDRLRDDRLVGHSPTLTFFDEGMARSHIQHGDVFRSRVSLNASGKKNATVSSIAFFVDRNLMALLKQGDMLYVSRTGVGGLGLSLLRNDELVLAVGAVTAVPLGIRVQVRCPYELMQEAETVFKRADPDFRFLERPLRFSSDGGSQIRFSGGGRLGDYHFLVRHGFLDGMPGTNECVAIWRQGENAATPARTTAEMLDSANALKMVEW